MNKSNTIKELAGALAKAQAEMPVVRMDAKNPFLKYKYATLGAIINACRPVLARHELSVVQLPVSDGDKIGVTTILTHSSGEWLEDSVFISSEEQKGLSQAQSAGVVITYLRRYSLASLLGVYADEDTDGTEGENGHKPDVVLEKKPVPEKKVPAPASDMQKLRADFSQRFMKARDLNLDVSALPGGATAEQIAAAIKAIDEKIEAVK